MTDLEISNAELRPTSTARADAFRALAEENKRLRAATTPIPVPAADAIAVEARLRQISNEIHDNERDNMNDTIAAVGGTTPQPERARNLGFRWYAGIDRGDTYDPHTKRNSWFMDMTNFTRDPDALARLQKNSKLRHDEERRMGLVPLAEQRTPLSTTNGAGGEFSPPLWLEADFVQYARPGRITADLCSREPLPAGTDVINLPKIATGTATAPQIAQNTGIQETDITTTSVASPVVTIAGGQTISLQLLEQSPLNIDRVILQDLARAYAVSLNTQVLSGPGTAGQLTGLLTLAGTNGVTFSGTTLTGANSLYSAILKAAQLIQTSRFDSPTAIAVHPRRWGWMLEQADTLNRPIMSVRDGGPYNTLGVVEVDAAAQGYVGTIGGLRVYLDALIPVNLGAGANEDRVIVFKADDVFLWESDIRLEAFQQTYAQNMSVFARAYDYVAFQPARYPQSISVISGTGLDIAD